MSTHEIERPVPTRADADASRGSAWFGVGYAACQLSFLALMVVVVLPSGGSMSDPAAEKGRQVLDNADLYQTANYLIALACAPMLGFLGAVQARLRRADPAGVLATVAVAAGALLALVWPLGGVLHSVAMEAARTGADVRLLAGWDAVAPYSLALSALVRAFFLGAVVLGLRAAGTGPWLQRTGVVLLVLSLGGSATVAAGAMFPLLALSTLGFAVWVGALAWSWTRRT